MKRYNPDLVTVVLAEKDQSEIAVVTADNLAAFAESAGIQHRGFVSPLIRGIHRAGKRGQDCSQGDRTFVTGYVSSPRKPYIYRDENIYGILADAAPRLLEDLQNDEFRIRGLNQNGIESLALFCGELCLEDSPGEPSARS